MAVMAVLVLPTLLAGGPAAAGPLADGHAVPVPVVALDLEVALVFSGFALTAPEKAALEDAIGNTWVPFVVPTGFPIGVEYDVALRFIDTSSAFDGALAGAITASFANDTLGRVVGNYPGLFENLTAAFPSVQQGTPVPHADADEVLAWLAASDAAFPEVAAGADEARFFFLNPAGVDAPYYYRVHSQDRDTGENFTFETANAWGGDALVFFQDLRAAPNHLGEGTTDGRPANFAGQPPLWSYGNSAGERARLIADLAHYVNTSVRVLAAPSYAVTPFYPASLTLDVTLFDGTSTQDAFTPGGAGAAHGFSAAADILDTAAVRAALSDLLQVAPVAANLRVSNRTTDPDIGSSVTAHLSAGPGGAVLLDPFAVNDDLKARFAVPDHPVLPGEDVTVPALVVVLDEEAYIQSPGTRGATLQRSDGRAAAVIIAGGLDQLEGRGFTDTLIHEAGHALGLGHPHELALPSAGGPADVFVDWLRDLSSTPMTYLPNYVDYTFDSFDRRAVESGMAATTLAAAYIARQEAYSALDNRAYSNTTLPESFATAESLFGAFAAAAAASMAAGEFFVPAGVSSAPAGAVISAKRAYDQAKDMLIDAVLLPRCCGDGDAPRFLPGAGAALGLAAVAAAAGAASRALMRRRQ